MSLTLKEKLAILLINPKTGWMNNQYSAYMIIAAAFFELIKQEKIEIKDKKVHLKNSKRTRDPLLDLVIEKIRESEKQKKLKTWIKRFGMKGGRIKRIIGRQLQDHRIITVKRVKILWLFPASKYYFRDAKVQKKLIAEITTVVQNQKTDDEDLFVLLNFFVASKSLNKLFKEKTDRSRAREIIKKLESENEVFKSLSDVIRELKTAVAASAAVVGS